MLNMGGGRIMPKLEQIRWLTAVHTMVIDELVFFRTRTFKNSYRKKHGEDPESISVHDDIYLLSNVGPDKSTLQSQAPC